jgi:membrane protease YdiL (CAAX protease family)
MLVVQFFVLTFALAWAAFFGAGALDNGTLRASLFVLGAFAPAVVALWLTARAEGREDARALLRRVVAWRVDARWYMFAAGYLALIKLAVALAHRLITGAWPLFGDHAWYILIPAIVVATPTKAGEEIGWRGYALPRLAARLGLGWASVLLGVIWACWHLPLFFIPGTDTTGQSFPLFLLEVTGLSVALAWLYARTNGSLLLVMLLHSAVNETHDIVPSVVPGATQPFALSPSLPAWLTVAFLWIGAAYFFVRMPRRTGWA